MPNRIKFTQLAVERLTPPASGVATYWDATLPGFGLRVYAPRPGREGRKSWIAMGRVEGKAVLETLGTMAQIPKVDEARRRAREAMQKMRAGVKPLDERRAEKARQDAAAEAEANLLTVRKAVDHWLAEGKREWRPATAAEWRRIFDHDILPKWGNRPLAEITKADVLMLVNDKAERRERPRKGTNGGSAVQAGKMLTRLRTFFGWAVANDLLAADPSAGVRKPATARTRDRVLNDAEIVALWKGCERVGWPFGAIFRLLLITGQREGEVAGMWWSELDLDGRVWTIPRERTKSDRGHVVHLSDLAAEIIGGLPRLSGDLVFPSRAGSLISSFSKAKQRLDEAMAAQTGEAVEPFVIHDLRRTATTVLARLNVAPHVADKVLNHTAGTIRGVAAVYNRFQYLDERKAALEALGRFIDGLVRPTPSNVVPIRSAG